VLSYIGHLFAGNQAAPASGNILYKYFSEVMQEFPSSEAEEEEEECDEADISDNAEEDDDDDGSDEDEYSREVIGVAQSAPKLQDIRQVTPTRPLTPQAAESQTESESEEDKIPPFPASASTTAIQAEEISVTESETDNEESANQLASKPLVHTRNDTGSSDTESDSEDENDLRAGMNPKPMLIRDASQPTLGPLILDAESNTRVPALINTFLREYQRDGIRFFWERYRNGRGGILGDDMGLGIIFLLSSMQGRNYSKYTNCREENTSYIV